MREIISRERINDSLTDITFELIKSSTTLWIFLTNDITTFWLRIWGFERYLGEKNRIKFMHRGDKFVFGSAPQIDLILRWPLQRTRIRPLVFL